jgi:membrane carboxypeptidase/penicillin-binding protein
VKFTGWYAQGGKAAAPIWGRFMGKVYSDPRLPYKQTKFTVDRSQIDTTRASKEINENEDNALDANSVNSSTNNQTEEVNLPQEAPKEPTAPKEPSEKKSTDAKPSPTALPPKRKFPSLNN